MQDPRIRSILRKEMRQLRLLWTVMLRPGNVHRTDLSFDHIPCEHIESAVRRYATAVMVALALSEGSAL